MAFIKTILRGIGQVMFQNNVYSGLLFLAGIFYNSYQLGLAALAGTVLSTATAHVLKYPKEELEDGIYGFNGTLTGIAIIFFFGVSITAVLALIAGSVLSTVAMYFLKKVISPFTAPFVLSASIVIYSLLHLLDYPLIISTSSPESTLDLLTASSNGIGQVMFQKNVITGLFFLLAVLINDRLMALYTVYATVLGALTGWYFNFPIAEINGGFMGYNAILCAIALTGKNWRDFLWISLAIVLSSILNKGMAMMGIITLTAPFVLVTWVILKAKQFAQIKS
ncbi:MAG: urea transporter [Flavobacteriales bacterium]|nr:urea transporter [Flavobacteriales bacterium]